MHKVIWGFAMLTFFYICVAVVMSSNAADETIIDNSTLYRRSTLENIQVAEDKVDSTIAFLKSSGVVVAVIKKLAHDGTICDAIGHRFEHVINLGVVNTVFNPNFDYSQPETRRCSICSLTQTRSMSEWR